VGGELEGRFHPNSSLQLRLSGGVAHTVFRSVGALLTGAPEVHNPLFPTYQIHLVGEHRMPWLGLQTTLELSWIGPRGASQSNALVAGAAYQVPGFLYTAAALALPEQELFPGRKTRIALRVTNLLNQAWEEPGFGGVDVPTQGVTALLTVVQSL